METGTGKTYVYTNTIFELHKRYKLNKFIIAVPSLAIKAGTAQFLKDIRSDHSHEYALRTLKYLCILPGAFFFVAPMSESLFLLLSVSCIYLLRKKKWFFACLLGGLAAFTRSLGLVLIVPILHEMFRDRVEVEELVPSHGSGNRFDKFKWVGKYIHTCL